MYLTEEQIKSREDKFVEMVEMLADELYENINEDHVMSEEEEEIASEMLDYFTENFKDYTLREAAVVAMTGQDENADLVEAYIELALDESIGGMVSGAIHGIKNLISKGKADRAAKSHAGAKSTAKTIAKKASTAGKAASKSTGLKGVFKKAKADALNKRHDKAIDKEVASKNAHSAAKKEHRSALKQRVAMKRKIDTHVQSAKDKVKRGVERVVGAAGRVAGSFA